MDLHSDTLATLHPSAPRAVLLELEAEAQRGGGAAIVLPDRAERARPEVRPELVEVPRCERAQGLQHGLRLEVPAPWGGGRAVREGCGRNRTHAKITLQVALIIAEMLCCRMSYN